MSTTQQTLAPREEARRFLAREVHQLLIDGQQVPASSGETLTTVNPSTGEVLAHLAAGGHADVDRAVRAARKAFVGPWSRWSPYERQALLTRIARCSTSGSTNSSRSRPWTWEPQSRGCATASPRLMKMLAFFAGQATNISGETLMNGIPGEVTTMTLEGAGRGHRRDHPLEWSAQRPVLDHRRGPGQRVHGSAEAVRGRLPVRAAGGRAPSRSRCPGGRRQRRHRHGHGRRATRWQRTPTSTASLSPDRPRPAAASSRRRPSTSRSSSSSSAASRPTSSARSRTWTRRCQAPRWGCSPTPGRSVTPAPGCWSSGPSSTSSPSGCWRS